MYTHLQQNPQINYILVVEFRNLKQNDKVRTKCTETLQCDLSDDDYIVYSPSDNDITVLGRLVLNDENITTSTMYGSLRNNTTSFYGEDHTERLQQITCRKIEKWIFDESLKNKSHLSQIFSFICRETSKEAMILWYEGTEEIIFYPVINDQMIFARPSAVSYFTNAFLNE